MRPNRLPLVFAGVVVGAVLAGCTGGGSQLGPSGAQSAAPPTSSAPPAPSTAPGTPTGNGLGVVPRVAVTRQDVVTGLASPWGIAGLADGRLLITLRDEGRLVLVDPVSGEVRDVSGVGADALHNETVHRGEGGLLGVAVGPADSAAAGEVFIYRTGTDGNAVLRGRLDPGGPGAGPVLGPLSTILDGIPAATNHNGGRLAFGPDGVLYVATGDATDRGRAQDPGSLGGKILRIAVDGNPAPGNPVDGSPVWSLGHRNVQGLGWDATGRMFASEFGQDTWDELNVIVPGGNYGWPGVEGPGGARDGFVDPVETWTTGEASPSGIAVTAEGVYVAALRGERLWRVPFASAGVGDAGAADAAGFGAPQVVADGLGRLRAVYADPASPPASDGTSTLYVLTNNTDGRGTPRDGDDRLVRLTVRPAG